MLSILIISSDLNSHSGLPSNVARGTEGLEQVVDEGFPHFVGLDVVVVNVQEHTKHVVSFQTFLTQIYQSCPILFSK